MPKTRSSLEDEELQELRALRQELNINRQDTDVLRQEVSQIRTDLTVVSNKQGEVVDAITSMNSAIANISNQLTSMSTAINSLHHPTTTNATQQLSLEQHDRHAAQKSPTFQNAQQQPQGQYTKALKQCLLQEQEKTNQLEFAQNKLPSINTGRKSAPLVFLDSTERFPK
jgi:chromosome segregation ATPase